MSDQFDEEGNKLQLAYNWLKWINNQFKSNENKDNRGIK